MGFGNYGGSAKKEPTEKQKKYLKRLAKAAGRTVDVENITRLEASKLIDDLKGHDEVEDGGADDGSDSWDRRAAFGMATKLVFQRLLATEQDVHIDEDFWNDVREFFATYQKEQERALSPPPAMV